MPPKALSRQWHAHELRPCHCHSGEARDRLTKVQRTDLVGKRMMKTFGGHGTFVGDIVSYDPETGCYQQVTYEDGDKEGLSRASVQAGVRRFQAQAK
ncbi:hypothetical protein EMIHUDRAFT_460814 [Emiliania huxleyi CCMP1516]|uniref:PTM/DIR17-like Tudor domain-containing protein n=2 Tax=Emiliania huxleyi TaxID=2903 RepID=A0A0D3IXB3_EMIH1|nr:hypothetical protein EMIHUDRAFT_460814 [Emiliania huxleyi CCMP1516]EOD15898.1 hypothetical protein EMIHUDRAFT_460814 [Emiliania huxleyi CCMP1516]|eukprot:XP_005768327.1 hypothetical protein EMIHUDRAFT_460814 [Emiliania huxleyi CCMP1516]